MIYSLWMTCHGYDKIKLTELRYHKEIYDEMKEQESYPSVKLNDPLIYKSLKDRDWSYYKQMQPTILTAHNLKVWDVTYQRGTFFEQSHAEDLCPSINCVDYTIALLIQIFIPIKDIQTVYFILCMELALSYSLVGLVGVFLMIPHIIS